MIINQCDRITGPLTVSNLPEYILGRHINSMSFEWRVYKSAAPQILWQQTLMGSYSKLAAFDALALAQIVLTEEPHRR
jgi:hypothetical protein